MFSYFKSLYWSYEYFCKNNKTEENLQNIIYNVKNGGCVLIKLVQWLLPIIEVHYDIDIKKDENKWFRDLESIYDNCFIHSLSYTKKKYKKLFNKNIEDDYEIIDIIGSGSIGQVYKIKNIKTGEFYALKCVHPSLSCELHIVNFILKCVYKLPIISKYLKYYIPVDIRYFIIVQ